MYENYVVAGNDGQVKDDRLRALARRKPRGFQPQWLGVFGFSPCLSLLFKVLSCPMNGIDNGLIIARNPRLHADNQDGAEISLREANHRGFAFFLFHAIMLASCILLVNVIYFIQYVEN